MQHYHDIFELFDVIHFNSTLTESVYKEHLTLQDTAVIPITHAQIEDNRRPRLYDSKMLNLIFIGSTSIYKGFQMLRDVLSELYDEGERDWQLDVWGATGRSDCPLIRYNGYYAPSELSSIYHVDSLLITPSIWNETFSLTTLEALSYGTPALLSSTVGAKDIVAGYDPWFVFEGRAELRLKIRELLHGRSRLKEFNRSIVEEEWSHSLKDHNGRVLALYNRI